MNWRRQLNKCLTKLLTAEVEKEISNGTFLPSEMNGKAPNLTELAIMMKGMTKNDISQLRKGVHKFMPIVADLIDENKYVTAILGQTWMHRETCKIPADEKADCEICSLLYKRTEPLKLIETKIDCLAKESRRSKEPEPIKMITIDQESD